VKKVAGMTADALVELFAEIGTAQAEAIDFFETARFNRLYNRKIAVVNELRSRPGDQRERLFALYDHPNRQVRLNAAQSTYALNPVAARAVLEEIAASRRMPQAANARLSLDRIAEGTSALVDDPWIPATRKERLELHRARMAETAQSDPTQMSR
jgi:hypothetical protein